MSKQERLKKAFQYLKSIGTVHTQKDVAEAMGASESNVSSAFKGVEKVLTDNFLNRFARTYGISLDWLLTGQGEMIIKKEAAGNPIRGNVTHIGNISGVRLQSFGNVPESLSQLVIFVLKDKKNADDIRTRSPALKSIVYQISSPDSRRTSV